MRSINAPWGSIHVLCSLRGSFGSLFFVSAVIALTTIAFLSPSTSTMTLQTSYNAAFVRPPDSFRSHFGI